MKIKVVDTCIAADARDLRESQTLAMHFTGLLSRIFQSTEPFDDAESDPDQEAEE